VEVQQRPSEAGLLSSYDFFLSHSPYNKIVRKVFARLVLADALRWDRPGCVRAWLCGSSHPSKWYVFGSRSHHGAGRVCGCDGWVESDKSNIIMVCWVHHLLP
jgi:hypothetical protein